MFVCFLFMRRRSVIFLKQFVKVRNTFYSDFIADFLYSVVRHREQIRGVVDFQFVDFFGERNAVIVLEFLAYIGLVVTELVVNLVHGVEVRETRRKNYIAFEYKFVVEVVFLRAGNNYVAEKIHDHAMIVFFHFVYILRCNVRRSVFFEVFHVAF